MRLGGGVADDELVLGRTARVLAGLGDQRAMRGQPGLAAPDRLLIKGGRAKIIAHHTGGFQADTIDRASRIAFADFRHWCPFLDLPHLCRRISGTPAVRAEMVKTRNAK